MGQWSNATSHKLPSCHEAFVRLTWTLAQNFPRRGVPASVSKSVLAWDTAIAFSVYQVRPCQFPDLVPIEMCHEASICPEPLIGRLSAATIPAENLIDFGDNPHHLKVDCFRVLFEDTCSEMIQVIGQVVLDGNVAKPTDRILGIVGEIGQHRVELTEPPIIAFPDVIYHRTNALA